MNKEKTLSAKLENLESLRFPFVAISYKVKDGSFRKGLLMIDTASTDNMLSAGIMQYIDSSAETGEFKEMAGIQGKRVKCAEYNIDFHIGNARFAEKFYVDTTNLDKIFGNGMIMGLVGVNFLRKYGFVLDYQQEALYVPSNKTNIKVENCSFCFPLSFGLSRYNLPTVPIPTDDKGMFFMFVDSGSQRSSCSKHDIELFAEDIEYTGMEKWINSIGNHEKTKEAHATINILSLDKDENLNPIQFDECFLVSEQNDHLVDFGNARYKNGNAMHISGLLSTEFLYKNKWVLDFTNGMIYSLK